VDEPLDLERARLLLIWLQARRALDHCLSELLAAGPAGERRVRGRLDLVDELEQKAQSAFASYRASVLSEQASPTRAVGHASVTALGPRRARASGEKT
jgi:hypothetical protein